MGFWVAGLRAWPVRAGRDTGRRLAPHPPTHACQPAAQALPGFPLAGLSQKPETDRSEAALPKSPRGAITPTPKPEALATPPQTPPPQPAWQPCTDLVSTSPSIHLHPIAQGWMAHSPGQGGPLQVAGYRRNWGLCWDTRAGEPRGFRMHGRPDGGRDAPASSHFTPQE